MKFETVEDSSTVSNFEYLVGVRYVDDESLLEFETTRVVTHKGLNVGLPSPDGKGEALKKNRPFTLLCQFQVS